MKGILEIMVQHPFIIKESSIRRKISQLDKEKEERVNGTDDMLITGRAA